MDDDPLPARRCSTSSSGSGSATPRVAEIPFTAFASRGKKQHHRAADRAPRPRPEPRPAVPDEQGELFPAWRHHAVFTDSPLVCCRPRPTTAATRSSNRSSPTSRTARSRTCRRGSSTQRRLARARRDRVQPHPRRRRTGLALPRQGDHRDHPPTTDQRPGPAGPLRPPHPLRLPTNWPWADDWLDLFTAALAPPTQPPPDHPAQRPRPRISGKAGQTGNPATPTPVQLNPRSTRLNDNSLRCIRAKPGSADDLGGLSVA